MTRVRGPPANGEVSPMGEPRKPAPIASFLPWEKLGFSEHFPEFSARFPHFSLDKQRACAVLLNHDERYKIRKDNDLRGMQHRLPTLWKTSQWTATLPLPTVRQDVHGRSRSDSGHDVYFQRAGLARPTAIA